MNSSPTEIAEELAAALRLDDDHFEAYKGQRRGDEVDFLIARYGHEQNSTLSDAMIILGNLYLPRRMESYIDVFTDGSTKPSICMSSLVAHQTPSPLFSRWGRENDGPGLAIMIAELYMSCSFDMDFNSPYLSPGTRHSLDQIHLLLSTFCVVTKAIPLSSTDFFPRLSPDFRLRFKTRLEAHSRPMNTFEATIGKYASQADQTLVDQTLVVLGAGRIFLRAETAEDWRKDWNSRNGLIVWWGCQWCDKMEKDSTCAKLKEGESMLGCGRCKAVKYCSTAHQKADWKNHKIYCHKPTW